MIDDCTFDITVVSKRTVIISCIEFKSNKLVVGNRNLPFQEGEAEIAAKMQDLALAEGALPRHLHTAMFTQSSDGRMLTVRQLSRHLVGLWVTGHPTAMALLKRIMVRR